jgi:CBS domain-containing protein
VKSHRTGAQWALDSLEGMGEATPAGERCRILTAAMLVRQRTGQPVHTWELATLEDREDDRSSYSTVDQVMSTDLFTVHPEDIIDLAASLMEWEHLRYVPVEDREGRLVGLITHRQLLKLNARAKSEPSSAAVRDLMISEPTTVTPETTTLEAIETMDRLKIGCLPVVRDGKLVGIPQSTEGRWQSHLLLRRRYSTRLGSRRSPVARRSRQSDPPTSTRNSGTPSSPTARRSGSR